MTDLGTSVNTGLGKAALDLIEKLYGHLSKRAGAYRDITKLKFVQGFAGYLLQTRTRLSQVKTIISRSAPVDISEAYVELRYSCAGNERSEANVRELLSGGHQILITGSAGCGKSMAMKKLFIDLVDGGGCIPVFVELRYLEPDDADHLVQVVVAGISDFVGGFTEEGLLFGLRNGQVCLLLDGFDEVHPDLRERVEASILTLTERCPKAKIVVSGRPDDRYSSWPTFHDHRVLGFDLAQVRSLVARVEFDDEIKATFIERVENGLINTHHYLLSNPLLCCMMLLTFNEFADVPSKMHVFYRTAFEVLIRKHDALKPRFQRHFSTGLESFDFARLFETFCFVSYSDRRVSFSEEEIEDSSQEAIEYEGLTISPKQLIDDLVYSACLILRDGDRYSFIHRSFQEYFTASFLLSRQPANFADLVDVVGWGSFDRSVIGFMRDMNREVMMTKFVPHAARAMLTEIKGGRKSIATALKFCSGFHIYRDGRMERFWKSPAGLAQKYYTLVSVVGGGAWGYLAIDPTMADELHQNLPPQFMNDEDDDNDDIQEAERVFVSIDAQDDPKLFAQVVEASEFVEFLRQRLRYCIKAADEVETKRAAALDTKVRRMTGRRA